jgi:hypothetical protein
MTDIDNDGVDDACDVLAETPPAEEALTIDEPVEETPNEETQNIDEPSEELPLEEEIEKGVPSKETVAGNEPIAEQGAVLGASTSASSSSQTTLSNTGNSIWKEIGVGISIIFAATYVFSRTRKYSYRLKR